METGSLIYYAGSGVCRIAGTTEMKNPDGPRTYYVLSLVFKPDSTLYVPCDNEMLTARMVPLLNEKEIAAALKKAAGTEPEWERDYRRRSEAFRRTLLTTDRVELLLLIKSVYRHRRDLAEGGKALHTTDDYFLRDAENLVYPEIAQVRGQSYDEAAEDVRRAILE